MCPDISEPADFGVNLCDEKFAPAANLLFFCFDLCAASNIAQDDALRMKLDTATLIAFEVIDFDELFAISNDLSQRDDLPVRPHLPPPVRVSLISTISSAIRCSLRKMSSANCSGGKCSKSSLAEGFLMSRLKIGQ
jgi:hypothetical protein